MVTVSVEPAPHPISEGATRGDLAAAAVLATILVGLVGYARDAVPDDAFIYLRVVGNLIAGHGWSYNAAEPIAVATSPLYVFLLSALHLTGMSGKACLLVAFSLGLIVIAWTMYWAFRSEGRGVAFLIALVLSTWPPLLQTIGMETSVLLACVVMTSAAYACERYWLTGFLAGSTALARPEGLSMLMVLLAVDLLNRRAPRWKTVLPCLIIVSGWLLFSLAEFGSIVPHTARVKAIHSRIPPWRYQGPWLAVFVRQLLPVHMESAWAPVCLGAILIPAWKGCQVAMYAARAGRPFALLVIGFGAIQLVGYAIADVPAAYFWYYSAPNFSLILAWLSGANTLWQSAEGVTIGRTNFGTTARRFVRPALVAAVLIPAYLFAAFNSSRFKGLHDTYRLSPQYTEVARWVAGRGRPHDAIASLEIGYVGYYSGLDMIDMAGLLDPNSLPALSDRKWDWWFSTAHLPRFIVTHDPAWIGEPDCVFDAWPESSRRSFHAEYCEIYRAGSIRLFGKTAEPSTVCRGT